MHSQLAAQHLHAKLRTLGGAIYYSLFRPTIDESNEFKDNKAEWFGDHICSYPAYLVIDGLGN